MDGQAKVTLLLEMKNRIKSGMSEAKKRVNSGVGSMKAKLTELKNHHVQMFSAMTAQFPLMGNALSTLGNPYTLLIGGVVALTMFLGKATNAAADFNHEFLAIKQLNLDKSQQQMDNYKDSIKAVAFETGQNLLDTTKAFYDIQSATGLFGKDVADITTKVGNYALVTGAKLPDAVNQTVKAMKAFGLGVNDIDNLLTANAKTVQLGITTYDELAKVQTEFAGAAAGAGQNVDTANKMFAVFTAIAKDSTTAATMTKSAFEGFTQAATVKGLKDMGVEMYDINGNMRDMTSILKDVSARFKGMSSKQVDETIAKIGGPEGLRNLLIKLKTDADGLLDTFTKYDSVQFDWAKAIKNAKGDFRTISSMAKNRLGVVMAEIGEKFLPLWVMALEKVNGVLSFVWNNFDTIWATVKNVGIALGVLKVAMVVFNAITAANPISMIILAIGALVAGITILIKRTEGWGDVWKGIKMLVIAGVKQIGADFKFMWDTAMYGLEYLWLKFKSFGQWIKGLFSNIANAIKLAFSGDFSGAKAALSSPIKTAASDEIVNLKKERAKTVDAYKKATADNVRKQMEGLSLISNLRWKSKKEMEEEGETSNPFGTEGEGSLNGPGGGLQSGNDSISKITGSAKQIKNITVNIDSFNKGGINTENTTLKNMDADDIEQWMTNMFLRVVRNVETSY